MHSLLGKCQRTRRIQVQGPHLLVPQHQRQRKRTDNAKLFGPLGEHRPTVSLIGDGTERMHRAGPIRVQTRPVVRLVLCLIQRQRRVTMERRSRRRLTPLERHPRMVGPDRALTREVRDPVQRVTQVLLVHQGRVQPRRQERQSRRGTRTSRTASPSGGSQVPVASRWADSGVTRRYPGTQPASPPC